VNIFRPSAISGSTMSGYTNLKDFTTLLLHTCATLSSVPKNASMMLNWVPVDFVAKSIVGIARGAPHVLPLETTMKRGVAYHLIGHGGPELSDVVQCMDKLGYKLERCSLDEWLKKLEKLPSNHPGYPVKHLLQNALFSRSTASQLPQSQTTEILSKIGIVNPRIDSVIISKSFQYMSSEGFFPSEPKN